jgi:hypothetical protein
MHKKFAVFYRFICGNVLIYKHNIEEHGFYSKYSLWILYIFKMKKVRRVANDFKSDYAEYN